jgi:hypothetical protein
VQHLAGSSEILATGAVIADPAASGVLERRGLLPRPHEATLRGVASAVSIFAIP